MDKTLEFKNFWDEKIKYIDTIIIEKIFYM